MSTVAATGPEYHCWTLMVEAMHEYCVSKKINKKDLHGVGYIPFIKTTLCIF
jgi:hypothetical protein